MRRILDAAVIAAIGFFSTFLVQVFLSYLTQDRGLIKFGSPVAISATRYLPISVQNYSEAVLDGLILSFPAGISEAEFFPSEPLVIERIPSTSGVQGRKLWRFSGFNPRHETQVLVLLPTPTQASEVSLVNADAAGVQVSELGKIGNPLRDVAAQAVITGGVYAVFLGIAAFYLNQKFLERAEKSHNAMRDVSEKLENAKKEAAEGKAEIGRIKLVLLRQIADYAKELDFWRDTIRKMLYDRAKKQSAADSLFSAVTDGLRTYSTRSGVKIQFEVIQALAEEISANERLTEKKRPE